MADHGVAKQKKEKECWEEVVRNSVVQKAYTRRVIHSLVGEYVEREIAESPDLVYKIVNPDESFVLGIEHFMVEQASVSKGSKVESKIAEYKGYINKLLSSDAAESDILPEIADKIFEIAKENNEKDYFDLMASFRYGFTKHNSRVGCYCKKL